jgi:hypothetical protein
VVYKAKNPVCYVKCWRGGDPPGKAALIAQEKSRTVFICKVRPRASRPLTPRSFNASLLSSSDWRETYWPGWRSELLLTWFVPSRVLAIYHIPYCRCGLLPDLVPYYIRSPTTAQFPQEDIQLVWVFYVYLMP